MHCEHARIPETPRDVMERELVHNCLYHNYPVGMTIYCLEFLGNMFRLVASKEWPWRD